MAQEALTTEEALTVWSVSPALTWPQAQTWTGEDIDITVNLATPVPIGRVRIAVDGLRMRMGPHIAAEIVGSWQNGAYCEVWGRSGDWLLLRQGERFGWSYRQYTEML